MTLNGVITTSRWLLSIRLGYRGLLIISEIITQCATCILLFDNRVDLIMFIDELFVSKFV